MFDHSIARVTYHDPCRIARNGGVYEAPRYILRQLTDDYVDPIPPSRSIGVAAEAEVW